MKAEKELINSIIMSCLLAAGMILLAGAVCMMIQSCTYNVSLVHTEGQATDVGDETADASPDVKPDISLPLSP